VAPAPAAAPPAEEIIDLSAPVETPRAAAAEPAPSGDLDFDLDLGDSAAPAAVEGAPALELPPGSETTGGGGLDFDIGGAPAAPSVESSAIDFQVPEAASVPSVPGETPESEFDSTSTVAMLETAAAAGSTTQANIVAEAKAQAGDPAKPPADMIMLDEAAGDEDHEKTIVVDFNMLDEPSGTPSGGNGAAPVADARWQEVATKLDLAKAYEEMGDKDGTRELLNEVLKEGDHAQQEQAKSILTRLG